MNPTVLRRPFVASAMIVGLGLALLSPSAHWRIPSPHAVVSVEMPAAPAAALFTNMSGISRTGVERLAATTLVPWLSVVKRCATVTGVKSCSWVQVYVVANPAPNIKCAKPGQALSNRAVVYWCTGSPSRWQRQPTPKVGVSCNVHQLAAYVGSQLVVCYPIGNGWQWVKAKKSNATPTPTPSATSTTPAPRITPTAPPDPAPSPISTDPTDPPNTKGSASDYTFGTVDGENQPAVWDKCALPIRYRVNPSNMPAGGLLELMTAMDQVSAWSGYTFEYVGSTDAVPFASALWYARYVTYLPSGNPVSNDVDLYVAFAPTSQLPNLQSYGEQVGLGGVTSYVPTGGGAKHVLFGAIAIASDIPLQSGFGIGSRRGEVLMHELGHALNLGHAKGESQVMYPYTTATTQSVFQRGDIAGMRALFARPCLPLP